MIFLSFPLNIHKKLNEEKKVKKLINYVHMVS